MSSQKLTILLEFSLLSRMHTLYYYNHVLAGQVFKKVVNQNLIHYIIVCVASTNQGLINKPSTCSYNFLYLKDSTTVNRKFLSGEISSILPALIGEKFICKLSLLC